MNQKIYYYYLLRSNKSIDDIRYVGVTTVTLKVRMSGHKYNALTKKKATPVYNWWRKRVKEGYAIYIEEIEAYQLNDWEAREQYWIRHYKQMGFQLLNVSQGGAGIVTKTMRSIESRQRSIDAHKIPVVALTLDGKFYKEFPSASEAANTFKCVHTAITNAISGFSKSACGYMWLQKKDYDPSKTYIYNNKAKLVVYEFDINGVCVQRFDKIGDICQKYKFNKDMVRKYIGLKKPYKDHIFSTEPQININEYLNT